jgi:dihydroflavonol-4-reductase
LEPFGLSYSYGDVRDLGSLVEAAQGCDALIHTAAVYNYWARDPEDIIQPALVGTRNAFEAARQAGVQLVIHTSTTWAVGLSRDPKKTLTANDWNDDPQNPYAVAKTRSEKEAWRLSEETGIPMISICPGGVLGAYDYRITPSTLTVKNWINRSTPIYKGGIGLADVRDVAQAFVKAIECGDYGRRYIIAGENLDNEAIGSLLESLTGLELRRLNVKRSTYKMIGSIYEIAARLTGTTPTFTRALADELVERYMFYDSQETYQQFGLTPTPPEVMFTDTIRWLLFMDQIKPKIAEKLKDKFQPLPEWTMAEAA